MRPISSRAKAAGLAAARRELRSRIARLRSDPECGPWLADSRNVRRLHAALETAFPVVAEGVLAQIRTERVLSGPAELPRSRQRRRVRRMRRLCRLRATSAACAPDDGGGSPPTRRRSSRALVLHVATVARLLHVDAAEVLRLHRDEGLPLAPVGDSAVTTWRGLLRWIEGRAQALPPGAPTAEDPRPGSEGVRFADVARRLHEAFPSRFPRLTRAAVASAVRHGERSRLEGRRPTHLLGRLRKARGGVRADDVETLVAYLEREREVGRARVGNAAARANASKREQPGTFRVAAGPTGPRIPS